MTDIQALEIIARLLGLLAVIQGAEFYLNRHRIEGVWRWSDLEPELGRWLRPFLNHFQILNFLRIAAGLAVLFFPLPAWVWFMFVLHVLTLLRWLGTYNGGSDYMNLLLLWTCALGLSIPQEMAQVCLYYVCFQLCFSYFRAGWIKIKNPRWRSGLALRAFVSSPVYARSVPTDFLVHRTWASRGGAWVVMLFELTFPVALLHPYTALGYMGAAFLFHLVNTYVFGLNRFLYAWAAAYPALYYAAQH